jgi:hypothetical protein
MSERTRFDVYLDGVVMRIHEQPLFSASFRTQFTEMIGLCRMIADYDLRLAREVFLCAFMVSYTSATSAIELVTSK